MIEPGVIKKLDEVVVNRIAAGEIIQRPANALKELLENSLDAKATIIQVTVKSGGLKLLQIQDNGTGIRKEDMAIVCERFTTSKLTTFEDLTSIATFGFRGEALASISHVAHLTIQTKTVKEKCGYKASYEDGKLKAPPKPCAGNQGTIITIEDLFYNMPQRQQALKSPNEEFQRISDVMSKYAIHNSKVGFTLKRFGEQPSVKTAPNSSQQANIETIYGASIAKELLAVELKDDVHKFQMNGYITKVNYSSKKGIMLFFINHRLVELASLKAAIDNVYSTYLPRGMHPFAYISLEINPSNIDVNVHPTKHEVHFLYEDEIVEKIKQNLETKLLGSNETRSFYKQLKMPGASEPLAGTKDLDSSLKNVSVDRINPQNMIRTDSKEQSIYKFLNVEGVKLNDSGCSMSLSSSSAGLPEESFRDIAHKKSKEVKLTSILNMQKKIENDCSIEIRKMVKELVFVGVVDKQFALFQHETKLYMADTIKLSEQLFYQRLLYEFENHKMISIKPQPLPVKDLIKLALNTPESGWTEEDGDKDELAERASEILIEKSPIMREYFSMTINSSGQLETIPSLLDKYIPSKTFLPIYMLRLATEVEWDTEEECFETFCRETARYYAMVSEAERLEMPKQHKWTVEHIIYPAFKKYLLPPNNLKKYIFELANLPSLYKVFERC
ncbi:DNA mismatch repair protein Mlh1 [Musca vetustissima]|uniref:DNA mismatch repair protein Mlh1 n=1 Tax=Musca vetustissima TaxID=27455 RepID=UPI002AB78383|nr:DNA mismatch repair protein Mlh1 [Musca vetustissima]